MAASRLRLPLLLSRHVMTQLGAAAPTTTQAAAVVASSTTTNTSHSCHVLRRSLFISPSAHAADASETTTSDTAAADKEAFLKRWRSVAPSTQVEPGFPVPDEEVAVAADTIPDTLSFSLYLPHKIVFDKMKVESVLVPGTEGDFGVKPGHVPTIAQLRPGVMTVIEAGEGKDGAGEERKYFVPAGFAVVHPNSSAEISALEAVPLDELDAETIKQGLADYTAKLAQGGDEYENAVAQVGIEVYSALSSAVADAK